MCGRYNLVTDADAIIDFFEVAKSSLSSQALKPRYNIAPSQEVAAVRLSSDGRELVMLHWGLIPSWSKESKIKYSTINARADTVDTKPAYRSAFKRQRCIIPCTGFYEWKVTESGKQPYYIGFEGLKLFGLAGLWDRWQGEGEQSIESCTIIVTDANSVILPVHDRMPVILGEQYFDQWLDADNKDIAALKSLLIPHDPKNMTIFAINKRVNNPSDDDPKCMEKVVNS